MTTTEHTALSALRARLYVLERTLRKTTIERDRHQRMVDTYQRQIEEAVAETNSINAAIELLDAATEYAGEQA